MPTSLWQYYSAFDGCKIYYIYQYITKNHLCFLLLFIDIYKGIDCLNDSIYVVETSKGTNQVPLIKNKLLFI